MDKVERAREGLSPDLLQKANGALAFAASRSALTAAEERAILAALSPQADKGGDGRHVHHCPLRDEPYDGSCPLCRGVASTPPAANLREALRPAIWAAVNDGMAVEDALDFAVAALSATTAPELEGVREALDAASALATCCMAQGCYSHDEIAEMARATKPTFTAARQALAAQVSL